MAYDEDLAERVRAALAGEPGITERGMFGGLAFLVEGHMSVTVRGRGGLLVRVDPQEASELLGQPHAHPFEMRGRAMEGWLHVSADGLASPDDLEPWVAHAVAYARGLPAKG